MTIAELCSYCGRTVDCYWVADSWRFSEHLLDHLGPAIMCEGSRTVWVDPKSDTRKQLKKGD